MALTTFLEHGVRAIWSLEEPQVACQRDTCGSLNHRVSLIYKIFCPLFRYHFCPSGFAAMPRVAKRWVISCHLAQGENNQEMGAEKTASILRFWHHSQHNVSVSLGVF